MASTTVHVSQATRKRLAAHKAHPQQRYDDVINLALDLMDEDELELSADFKRKIAAARRDVKRGKVYSTAQVKKALGL